MSQRSGSRAESSTSLTPSRETGLEIPTILIFRPRFALVLGRFWAILRGWCHCHVLFCLVRGCEWFNVGNISEAGYAIGVTIAVSDPAWSGDNSVWQEARSAQALSQLTAAIEALPQQLVQALARRASTDPLQFRCVTALGGRLGVPRPISVPTGPCGGVRAAEGRFRAKWGQIGRAGGIRPPYSAGDGRKRLGPTLDPHQTTRIYAGALVAKRAGRGIMPENKRTKAPVAANPWGFLNHSTRMGPGR